MLCVSQVHALDRQQQAEIVQAHNQHRANVGVSELSWSNRLADMAQDYANKLSDERACKLSHSDTRGIGENLYWASARRYSYGRKEIQQIRSKQVVDAWADEKKHYNYSSNSCNRGEVCGHYTQIVWANTSEIGCAKTICRDKSQVWVCNYYPAGNYIGKKPY